MNFDNFKKENTHIREFRSLIDFKKFIDTTPLNVVWHFGAEQASKTGDYSFTSTSSYEEAVDLFTHGWEVKAKVLKEKLGEKTLSNFTKTISVYDVAGFQASVPRYLQGIPTNMINSKRIQAKQKIINLVKDIGYPARVSAETIEAESLKVLRAIQTYESLGFAVNLSIVLGVSARQAPYESHIAKIKIKSSNERLNISKLAFPMAHPSMLRRLFFRYMEVCPDVKNRSFTYGYGTPMEQEIKKFLKKDEIYLKSI